MSRRKVIQEARWVEEEHKQVCWELKDNPGAGFCFDADDDWNIIEDGKTELGLDNLKMCREDDGTKFNGPRKTSYINRYREPRIIECDCGAHVALYMSLANPCDECSREYNASGQLLASRAQWGWDTGESESEIMQGNLPMDGSDKW